MTYIAAFHCMTGIVMCADTQETYGDYKNYVEKIITVADYPLAIGGAGFGDLIDASTDEIIERVKSEKPNSRPALKSLVKAALAEVYEKDLKALVVGKQHRTPELLIAARTPNDGFCIFPTKGRRVLPEVTKAVIGYQTAYNVFLLKRFHRETLSMQQAVMLAVYLVMRSKALDEGVGGDTRVAVVVDNGAWMDDPYYITDAEVRIKDFLKLTDSLFLDSVDMSISPSAFSEKLEQFRQEVAKRRENHINFASTYSLHKTLTDPTYKGDPYPKVFPGAIQTVSVDGSVAVREETKEERQRFNEITELAKKNAENFKEYELPRLLKGRKILYIGDETTTLYPKPSGSTE